MMISVGACFYTILGWLYSDHWTFCTINIPEPFARFVARSSQQTWFLEGCGCPVMDLHSIVWQGPWILVCRKVPDGLRKGMGCGNCEQKETEITGATRAHALVKVWDNDTDESLGCLCNGLKVRSGNCILRSGVNRRVPDFMIKSI